MKKMPYLLAFLLVFLVLTACNGDAVEDASVENVTASHTMLPEKKRLDPVSAPALITEGRIPSENYDLPTTCISLHEWEAFGDYPLALLAELPEADAAFYSLDWDKVLIRWEDSLAEFDWLFATPRPSRRRFGVQTWMATGRTNWRLTVTLAAVLASQLKNCIS